MAQWAVVSNAAGPDTVVERRIEGADRIGLAVQERGDPRDPSILLVHGYPDDHGVWDLVAAELADGHHVVTYDCRGAGRSDVPEGGGGYRLELLVADLVAVADAAAGPAPVHLVGHDWGSIQGWAAVTTPEVAGRFASFTSISGPSLDHVAAWTRRHRVPGGGRWREGSLQALRSWYIAALATPVAPWAWRRGPMADRWAEQLARTEGARVDETWPGPHLRSNGANGVGLYRDNLFGRREVGAATTSVPVQVIVPTGDRFVTPALLDGIEAMAPDLVRHDVAGGHWIPRSAPDLVASLVARHIASAG